jgi:ubiquinone/menaquinone biosynthesis C-methylase UbiE
MVAAAEISEAPRHGRSRVAFELLGHPGSLLDYGCGDGSFASKTAQSLGITVDACDINPTLIDRAKGQPGVRSHLISPGDPRLPIDTGQVEAVTCCDVLEHMSEDVRRTALKEIHRVLADGGVLIVTTPHRGLLSFADPENFKFYVPRLHRTVYRALKGGEVYERRYGVQPGNYSGGGVQRHRHFSAGELTQILGESGFQVEAVRYFTLIYPAARIALWTAQGVQHRLAPLSRSLDRICGRLVRWLWRVYTWDSDLECGRASDSIAVRARKVGQA